METHRERVKEMERALREREDELSRAVRVEESRERRWEDGERDAGDEVRRVARRVDATETEARREREAYESTREALRKAEGGTGDGESGDWVAAGGRGERRAAERRARARRAAEGERGRDERAAAEEARGESEEARRRIMALEASNSEVKRIVGGGVGGNVPGRETRRRRRVSRRGVSRASGSTSVDARRSR